MKTEKQLLRSKTVLLVLALFAVSLHCEAEVNCRAQVNYRWKPDGTEVAQAVHWLTLESSGKTEPEAKHLLDRRVNHEKRRAEESCARHHETISRCLSSKHAAAVSIVPAMSFAARKRFEESIESECKAQHGRCIDAEGTEPLCEEKAVEQAPPAEEQDSKGGKKADKAADKEKKK